MLSVDIRDFMILEECCSGLCEIGDFISAQTLDPAVLARMRGF